MTTKYYLISSNYISDMNSSLIDQPDRLKSAPPAKFALTFPPVPRVLSWGCAGWSRSSCLSIWAFCRHYTLPLLSVTLMRLTWRCFYYLSDLVLAVGRVPSVPLATQFQAKTSSSPNSTSRDKAASSHKTSPNVGCGPDHVAKYYIE